MVGDNCNKTRLYQKLLFGFLSRSQYYYLATCTFKLKNLHDYLGFFKASFELIVTWLNIFNIKVSQIIYVISNVTERFMIINIAFCVEKSTKHIAGRKK